MSWRAWTVFAALSVIWGVPYFFIKLAVTQIAPVDIAWGRIALGAAILLPVAWKRGALSAIAAHKRAITAFAIAELVVPFTLIAAGEQWLSSSLTGVLIATVPMNVLLLSPLFGLKEPLRARRLIGLVTGFAGVIVLLGLDMGGGALAWAGVACIWISTIGYALAPLIVQRHLADVDELGAVAVSLAIATVVLAPGAIWAAPHTMPSTVALASIGVLGVVCTALGLMLFFTLIKLAGAARATIITYINPAVAALLGVVLLHEHFGPSGLLGLAMILTGSWLSTHRPAVAVAAVAEPSP